MNEQAHQAVAGITTKVAQEMALLNAFMAKYRMVHQPGQNRGDDGVGGGRFFS